MSRRTIPACPCFAMVAALTAIMFGCTGQIDPLRAGTAVDRDETGTPDGNEPLPEEYQAQDGYIFQCASLAERGLADARVRRLTSEELKRTFQDLLGDELAESLRGQLELLPAEETSELASGHQPLHDPTHVRGLFQIARSAAASVVREEALVRFAESCRGAGPAPTEACRLEFTETLGARAFRRPLRPEELADFEQTFEAEEDPAMGLYAVAMRIFLAPEFLFELRQIDDESNAPRAHLDAFEVASRVSYAVTGTMPDAPLLEAARRGELETVSQVESHVERLLLSEQGNDRLWRFFVSWLSLDAPSVNEEVAARHAIETEGLDEEMLEELRTFVEHTVLDEGATYAELLQSRTIFPATERIAKLLGVDQSESPVESPYPRGLLLRPASLASHGVHPSPILRGALLRRRVLCDEIPDPDPAVVDNRREEVGELDRTMLTNRQVIETLTDAGAECRGCHALVNPLGYALENFDSLGVWRDAEIIYEGDEPVAMHAIDARISDPKIDRDGPETINGPEALMAAIAESDKGLACLIRQMLQFVRRREDTPADACTLRDMENVLRDGQSISRAFVRSIANEDIFWVGTPSAEGP